MTCAHICVRRLALVDLPRNSLDSYCRGPTLYLVAGQGDACPCPTDLQQAYLCPLVQSEFGVVRVVSLVQAQANTNVTFILNCRSG